MRKTAMHTMISSSPQRETNWAANKLQPADRAIHDWYRFVLSFPPHLVKHYLEKFRLGPGDTILDPFCGTGTTLAECKKLGISSIGIEAHPMAHFASSVKVDWTPTPDGLVRHAKRVADTALSMLKAEGIQGEPPNGDGQPRMRTLPPESHKLLLTNSISPLPLHKTLALLDCLTACQEQSYFSHERLALAKALVSHISNLKFGPEVGVGPAKKDAPVIEAWLNEVQKMAADLEKAQSLEECDATVHCEDSRNIESSLKSQSIDAVFTSPPYPNEKDYTRTTRLESVLLGFVQSRSELRRVKQTLLRSNTRGVYKTDDDDAWVAHHAVVQQIAKTIEEKRIELNKTSGFERQYHRVTKLYFGGMARHLANLRRVLKPGARLAYVVGDQASYLRVMIKTGQILGDIAESLGYRVEDIDLFRTRLATATKAQLREQVLLLRWPGRQKKSGLKG